MKNKYISFSLFFILVFSFCIDGFSQSIINMGNVSGEWTRANSPYIIKGNITVASNDSLIIEAGVQVQFDTLCKMDINGLLIAEGTKEDSIYFTNSSTHKSWEGLYFHAKYPEEFSNLSYCVIEKAVSPNEKGGGVFTSTSFLQIKNSAIRDNSASSGGGIYCAASPQIINTKIINNKAGSGGGITIRSVYLGHESGSTTDIKPVFKGCLISRNTADRYAAIYVDTPWQPTFTNCTICYNESLDSDTQAIYLGSGEFYNSILYYNIPAHYRVREYITKPIIKYCNIEGGLDFVKQNRSWTLGNNMFTGIYENNINVPPQFTASDNNDFSLAVSHCINNGSEDTEITEYSTDIMGNQRVVDGRIDIGAFEYQYATPNRPPYFTPVDTTYIFKRAKTNIPISFIDDDTSGQTVTAYINDANANAEVTNVSDSLFNIDITTNFTRDTTLYLFFEINDNNSQNPLKCFDSIPIAVSKKFKGFIEYPVTFQDTVIVDGNITITKEGVLNILPGTFIEFQDFYSIYTYGKIKAIGTEDEKIEFNAIDTIVERMDYGNVDYHRGWGGITFYDVNKTDTIKFQNCIFRNTGTYGLSGLYANYCHGTLVLNNSKNFYFRDCLFDSNFTYKEKTNAGIALDSSSNVNVINCEFKNGFTREFEGNYITCHNSQINVDSCKFINSYNNASQYNASCVASYSSDIDISNSYFTNNTCRELIHISSGTAIIRNCLLENNFGVGIWISANNGLIINNKIINNGIAVEARATVNIINNLISHSKLYCNCSNFYGVAIYLDGAGQSKVINNTIVNSFQDSFGNAIYYSYCSPIIINNIFWNNNREGIGGYNGAGLNYDDPVIKNNFIPENSKDDPLFSLTDTLDFRLLKESPCINKGIINDTILDLLPDLDLDNNNRIDQITNLLDLGAYEFQDHETVDDGDGDDGDGDDDSDIVTSVESLELGCEIYPNPARNFLYLDKKLTRDNHITICDLNGKVFKSQQSYSQKIDISSLPDGVYVIHIKDGSGRISSKFIKH